MRIWPFLLGSWLLMHGLSNLIELSFKYDDMVMASLALLAGVFVIIRR